MARYQIALITPPADWTPKGPDDVPPAPGEPFRTLAETEDFFAAVRQAIEHNEEAQTGSSGDWAVVVEPGAFGRMWRHARLATPLAYKVAAIWWPSGWEPTSPSDVPNCVWRSHGEAESQHLTYPQAVAIVRGLNRQSRDQGGAMWYVVLAVENEPISQTVSYDPSGIETTVQVRRLHVAQPADEGSRGDCSHCPARSFDCARDGGALAEQTLTESRSQR